MRATETEHSTPESCHGIVVPPGCDNPMLHECGEPVSTYIPASYKPFQASKLPTSPIPHSMHGKTGGLSVPKNKNTLSQKSMAEYLNHFKGAQLCLDLWMNGHTKFKTCGILIEVGADFLALQEPRNNKLTLIDLKPVRYINLYCK